MPWVEKQEILAGVLNMCESNLGIQPGESILVLTDPPTLAEWAELEPDDLIAVLERSHLAKIVAGIIAEKYRDNVVEFYPFPATPRGGAEPAPEVAAKMRDFPVIVMITSKSLSHTVARHEASRLGARIASTSFTARMFLPDGPMSADYDRIAADSRLIADLLSRTGHVRVTSSAGTDIAFRTGNRSAHADDGLLRRSGAFGNLPAGEAFIAPVEGSAEGTIVVSPGWFRGLTEYMTLQFSGGLVVSVEGGGAVGRQIRNVLGLDDDARHLEPFRSRRNLAEFGVGTNPQASSLETGLEAEKIRGTVHLAVGDNAHFGGATSADYHRDFVIPEATFWLDGTLVMEQGHFVGPLSSLA